MIRSHEYALFLGGLLGVEIVAVALGKRPLQAADAVAMALAMPVAVVAVGAVVALRRRHPVALGCGGGGAGHDHAGSGGVAPVMQRWRIDVHVVIHCVW